MLVRARTRALVIGAAGLALLVSLYIMTYGKGPHASLPGCSADTYCNDVTSGRWATLAGIPVALLGIAGYAGLMITTLLLPLKSFSPYRRSLWSLMVIMSLIGIGFIGWLTGLQGIVIGHFCIYCMSAHAFGLVAFLTLLASAPVWHPPLRAVFRHGVPACFALSLLIGIHVLVVPNETLAVDADHLALTNAPPSGSSSGGIQIGKQSPSRIITVLDGNLTFDIHKVPFLGNPDAQHVIVELYDYNCPSCRKVSRLLRELVERRPGEIAIVCLPVPMEADCNPELNHTMTVFRDSCDYAAFAMAVCAADRKAFAEYHHWMMQERDTPPVDEARAHAAERVGTQAFEAGLEDKTASGWIADGLNIYRFIDAKTLPKILAGDAVISSAGLSRNKLFGSIEDALGLPPLDPDP